MNDDDFVRAVRWVCVTMLGVVAMILAAAVMCLPPDNPPPPHASLIIEIDPATGQAETIDNQTGYAVTNLVLRGTTVRFDLVAPK